MCIYHNLFVGLEYAFWTAGVHLPQKLKRRPLIFCLHHIPKRAIQQIKHSRADPAVTEYSTFAQQILAYPSKIAIHNIFTFLMS